MSRASPAKLPSGSSIIQRDTLEFLLQFTDISRDYYLYLIVLVHIDGTHYLKFGETKNAPIKRFSAYLSDYKDIVSIIPLVIWKSPFSDRFFLSKKDVKSKLLKDVYIGNKRRKELLEFTSYNISFITKLVSQSYFIDNTYVHTDTFLVYNYCDNNRIQNYVADTLIYPDEHILVADNCMVTDYKPANFLPKSVNFG